MAVEPLKTAGLGLSAFEPIKNVDPGILMMALSLVHTDLAYESAQLKLGGLRDIFTTLGKVAPLSNKVSQARNQVIRSELQSANGELAAINDFQSRYVDNAVINEADNQRFEEQKAWAAERGIELEDAAKTIELECEVEVETVDPETEEVTITTDTRTESRLVADQQAIARNEAKLEAYRSQARSGDADNAVIRQLVADHPILQQVQATLDELGQTEDLTTLSSLKEAAADLAAWKQSLLKAIEDRAHAAHGVHGELTSLRQRLESYLDATRKGTERIESHDQEYHEFIKATEELSKSNQEQISALVEGLSRLIQKLDEFVNELGQNNEEERVEARHKKSDPSEKSSESAPS